MFKISSAGGAPKVVVDLINGLNKLGKEVYLLTPFKLDYKKIESLYGPIKIKKVYYPDKIKSPICKGTFLPRKFMKKEFLEMIKEVDLVIDIDGGIIHKYLPKDFDNSKYIIWRFSCVNSKRPWEKNNLKKKIRETAKILLGSKRCIPSKNHKIYASDKWTRKELLNFLELNTEEKCLYPAVRVKELLEKRKEKKKQIAIFGRIAPNKSVDDSIKIFAEGTKEYQDYNLVIFGGGTADTGWYLKELKKIINELNILGRVKIIESPTSEELNKLILESKILIDSQRQISNTLTSIEALAAGCIILAHQESGAYTEVLDNGKYGYGFETLEDGAKKLKEIIEKLETKKLNSEDFSLRAEYFSEENFIKRLKNILEENGI